MHLRPSQVHGIGLQSLHLTLALLLQLRIRLGPGLGDLGTLGFRLRFRRLSPLLCLLPHRLLRLRR